MSARSWAAVASRLLTGNLSIAEMTQLSIACGRLGGVAEAILECHRFGLPEGDCGPPWLTAYHQRAAEVYFEALPVPYQRDVARLFDRCQQAMARASIPADLAEDWLIVESYLFSASSVIKELGPLHAARARSDSRAAPAAGADPHDTPREPASDAPGGQHGTAAGADPHDAPRERLPRVIRFDKLAVLTRSVEAERLLRAAEAVQARLRPTVPAQVSRLEEFLLRRLREGAKVSQIAAEVGYSRRSVYRALAGLWDKLGVAGRSEGLDRAVQMGLLD